jgi:hypothetical protein
MSKALENVKILSAIAKYVYVTEYGAVGDGVTDDGPACRAAVAAAVAAGGGTVYFPPGKYRLVKDPLDTTGNSCLTLPGGVNLVGDGYAGSNPIATSAPSIGTTLVPGGASTTLIRITGMYNSVSNMTLFNEAAHASTSAIRLAPQDEVQTSTRSDTSFNSFNELYVNNFDEGAVLRPGPTVSGADSYCYYNTFRNMVFFNCRIGLWLKEPPTQPGSGPNRNTFISMRFGGNSIGNVGVYIEAGDTNKFIACSFEGLQYGVSPQNPPTAIYIAYNSATFAASDNMFFGTIVEACTRAVTNVNDRLEFHGALFFPITTHELAVSSVTGFAVGQAVTATNMSAGTVTFVATSPNRVGVKRTGGSGVISGTLSNGTNTATITSATVETGVVNVSPTGALSLLTDPRTGAQVKAVGTNRAPTVAGDFYSPASDIVVKASTETGGVPEFRIDTGTAYGLYSFYSSGAKQWSIGAQATGVGNISFFNSSDTVLCQIRQNGELRPGANNSYDIGSSGNVWASTYSTNFRPGDGSPIWTSGAGSPEGAEAAPVGSLFTRTNGGAGTTLYVKESGSGNTGWVAK